MLAFIAVAAACYAKGHSDAAAACEIRIDDMQKAGQVKKDADAAKATDAAQGLEQDKADADKQSKPREVIVTKIIERPVYRDRCFDDDGLSVANSALLGTPAAAPVAGKPVP